jgi:hypothetical protein
MQSDDASLLMEENLHGDAGVYFKRIETYQKLSQTDRQTDPVTLRGVGVEREG